jgi:hypothetical protein
MRHLALAFLVPAVLWSSLASAEYLIRRDLGGSVEDHKEKFAAVRDSGQRVIIDGVCDSSCTLVLGIVPLSRICVTDQASLGFHMAYYDLALTDGNKVVSFLGTAEFMSIYPTAIKEWLGRNGGLTQNAIYLYGPELWAIVKLCDKRDQTKYRNR